MSENLESHNNIEENRDFLESLPAIGADETFCFDCNPEVPCFNRCCSELTLPLTPYDVMRLRRHLGMSSEDFITRHTTMQSYPDTGFPMPLLRMSDMPDEPCPFVTPAGCSVYENRPSACRAYPLGRGTTLGENGAVVERFFIVGEDHCHGFDVGVDRTPHEWFADQGLTEYNAANDRYMRLMAMVKATGKPLDTRLVNMSRLCLFHQEQFRQMITKMGIFSHTDVPLTRQALLMQDSVEGDTACLDFALDWLELCIFGQCPTLKRM